MTPPDLTEIDSADLFAPCGNTVGLFLPESLFVPALVRLAVSPDEDEEEDDVDDPEEEEDDLDEVEDDEDIEDTEDDDVEENERPDDLEDDPEDDPEDDDIPGTDEEDSESIRRLLVNRPPSPGIPSGGYLAGAVSR